nr:immunoglobulin light chain junction region [Macaca mulatta]MOW67806.1 immunoglobulin light chain junction region [Macaca mulatta]
DYYCTIWHISVWIF